MILLARIETSHVSEPLPHTSVWKFVLLRASRLLGSGFQRLGFKGPGFRDARSSLQSPLSSVSDAPRFTMLALKALANFVGTGSVLSAMLDAPDIGVGVAFWIMSFYYALMCYTHLHICFRSCNREDVRQEGCFLWIAHSGWPIP